MIAWILATGDEVVNGAVEDTNSAHIARALLEEGVRVERHMAVADDLDALVDAFTETGGRADVCVVTGGLGPTQDDLSAEAAARAAGTGLSLDPEALAWIEALFKAMDWKMNESNRKQAYLPETALRLDNPMGTAPGFSLDINRCRFFFLPGVPREMVRMLAQEVIPRIRLMDNRPLEVFRSRTLRTFGGGEAWVGQMVSGLEGEFPGLKLGLRALFPEVQVKLYLRTGDADEAKRVLSRAAGLVADRLGDRVFSLEDEDLEAVVGRLLRERGQTLALAESCTGGLVSQRITGVSGASDYFLLSAVTYANHAKTRLLGVSESTLAQHGAVSGETAREMARGAREAVGADWGLSTTGIAGPTGGTEEKPVGTVWVGLSGPDGDRSFRFRFPFPERERNKEIFATSALDVLRRALAGLEDPRYG
ncbi:MAG: CinA family nicotinamide mononucleotide deamidase-related protein [Pseudomonadota bacterium]